MSRTVRTKDRVPPPPRALSSRMRATWAELAAAVNETELFWRPTDLPAFRLLVRSVALLESPRAARMPATALVRLYQSTGAMFAAWGLTPAARAKVMRTRASARWLAAFGEQG